MNMLSQKRNSPSTDGSLDLEHEQSSINDLVYPRIVENEMYKVLSKWQEYLRVEESNIIISVPQPQWPQSDYVNIPKIFQDLLTQEKIHNAKLLKTLTLELISPHIIALQTVSKSLCHYTAKFETLNLFFRGSSSLVAGKALQAFLTNILRGLRGLQHLTLFVEKSSNFNTKDISGIVKIILTEGFRLKTLSIIFQE